ncbi:MAG: GNAT family N-acetyltransferase [Kiloniellales bacterium]
MPDTDPEVAPRKLDAEMPDYSDPGGDDFVALARDRVPVRSMQADDLDMIVRIDRKLTGTDRSQYYRRKLEEVMAESGVRISLVAELDGQPVGFVMARTDFGEFGRTEPAAVIDAVGVAPEHGREGVGRALMSQLLANLAALGVETVRTEVAWDNFSLLKFLHRCGFLPAQRLVLAKRVD